MGVMSVWRASEADGRALEAAGRASKAAGRRPEKNLRILLADY